MMSPARRLTCAIAGGAALVAAVGTVSAYADHAGAPAPDQIVKDCNANACEFTPSGELRQVLGPQAQISNAVFNCSASEVKHALKASTTTGTTTSVGLSMSATAGFKGVFEASVATTFNQEWQESTTLEESVEVTVPAGGVGWIEHAPALQQVIGKLKISYGSRVNEHFIWFLDGMTVTGPSPTSKGNLLVQARKMTPDEQGKCASTGTANIDGGAALVLGGGVVELPDEMDSSSAETTTPVGATVDLPPASSSEDSAVTPGD